MPSPATPSSPGGGEKESASDKTKASVLSQRLGIDPLDLVGWNENLRVWITQTVLRPLVKEIDSANAALPKQGVADCQIGQVAVERLRKVANLPQVRLEDPCAIKPNLPGGPVCSSPDCPPPLPGSLLRPALPAQPCAPPRQDRRALPLPLERWRRWLD